MTQPAPHPDRISRTVLLTMHDGTQPTLEAAYAAHEATGLIVVADDLNCRGTSAQASLLTAVATAVRAFGHVLVLADTPDAPITAGLHRGRRLIDVILAEGATMTTPEDLARTNTSWPTLLIGPTSHPPQSRTATSTAAILRAGWTLSLIHI